MHRHSWSGIYRSTYAALSQVGEADDSSTIEVSEKDAPKSRADRKTITSGFSHRHPQFPVAGHEFAS